MEQLFATHQSLSLLSQAIENTVILSFAQSIFLAIDLVIVLWCLRRFQFAAPLNRYRITVLSYAWLFGSTIWIFLYSFKYHQQSIIDNETFELLALSMPDALDKFLYFRQILGDFAALNVKWWLLTWYVALLVWASYFFWQHKNEKLPPLSSQRENIILYSLLIFISFNPIAWWLIAKIQREGKLACQ
jgi:hypothetical protein